MMHERAASREAWPNQPRDIEARAVMVLSGEVHGEILLYASVLDAR
jgi:hypothetical protein